MVAGGGLTKSSEKKRTEKEKGRKGKIYSLECRVPENSKERKESLLQ